MVDMSIEGACPHEKNIQIWYHSIREDIVPELPGCRTHGDTYEEAVKQGQDAIESWIIEAMADNDPIPAPSIAMSA